MCGGAIWSHRTNQVSDGAEHLAVRHAMHLCMLFAGLWRLVRCEVDSGIHWRRDWADVLETVAPQYRLDIRTLRHCDPLVRAVADKLNAEDPVCLAEVLDLERRVDLVFETLDHGSVRRRKQAVVRADAHDER